MNWLSLFADVFNTENLKNFSVIIAALSLISGINAWRREYIGKRRIELAEEVLTCFYEARDAIKFIRSPFSYDGEGKTRSRQNGELEEESKLLDRAYIVYERYEKRREVFNKLHSLRYRFMARFGRQTEKPFIELHSIVSDIFNAADILGSHYWQRQGRVKMKDDEFKTHLEEMHEQEAIFWYKGEKRDKRGQRSRNIAIR